MNLKNWMPLAFAGVLGLVAMVMARKVLKPSAPVRLPSSTTAVVVATRDVSPGKELAAEDVTVAQIPNGVVPSKSFTDTREVVGRAVTSPLVKGQSVLETLLAPEGTGAGLSALVPAGMRAMTMNIDDITGLAGMITPGCKVDVMAIVPDEKTKQQAARTVLQNIKIIAVGKQLSPQPADGAAPQAAANNLTFLLTPEQARVLQLAASTARPWLVLRSGRDGEPLKNDRTLIAALHGDKDEAGGQGLLGSLQKMLAGMPATRPAELAATTRPADEKPTHTRIVEVIHGSTVTHVSVALPAGFVAPVEPSEQTIPSPDGATATRPAPAGGEANPGEAIAPQPPSPRPAHQGAVTGTDQGDAVKSEVADPADPFRVEVEQK